MAFDPDSYLAEKAAPGGFDPDAYLSEKGQQPQGGFLRNALEDVKGIGSGLTRISKGITDLPSDAYQTAKGMMNGQSFSETPIGQDVQTVSGAALNALPHGVSDAQAGGSYRIEPGSIFRQYQDIAAQPLKYIPGQIGETMKRAYPENPFYKHPVDTGLALAPVAKPLMGAVRELPGVESAIDSTKNAIGQPLQDAANAMGRRVLRYPSRMLNSPEKIAQANQDAQLALNKGVIQSPITHPFSSSPEDMLNRARNLNEDYGENIGSYLGEKGGGVDANQAVSQLEELKSRFPPDDAVISKINNAQDLIRKSGQGENPNPLLGVYGEKPQDIPFGKANQLKGYLQKKGINWNTDQASQEVGKQIAGTFRQSLDDALQNVSGQGPEFNNFLENKRGFGSTSRMQEGLGANTARDTRNLPMSPLSIFAGLGEGIRGGSVLKGVATSLATEWVKRYGSATGATLANSLAKVFLRNPEKYSALLGESTTIAAPTIAALESSLRQEPEFHILFPDGSRQSGPKPLFEKIGKSMPPKAA